MIATSLVEYKRMNIPGGPPKLSSGCLYQYIWAKNGNFVYAENEFFRVLMPLKTWKTEDSRQIVRGLAPLQPYLHLASGRVSKVILHEIIARSRTNPRNEMLFYITGEPSAKMWWAFMPKQEQRPSSCRSLEQYHYTPIEIHSHNTMSAFFSDTDDAEETGLRIYAVIGRVDQPVVDIRVRVSVYGHYWTIPYEWVFEQPVEVQNA